MTKCGSIEIYRGKEILPERRRFRTESLRSDQETGGFVSFSDALSAAFVAKSDAAESKKMGQFFTPKEVALFMAAQFDIRGKEVRLLDPGAGIGSLTAAFCEEVKKQPRQVSVVADLYETDPKVIPLLERVLKGCKEGLEELGHSFKYNIVTKNFVLDNPNFLSTRTLFGNKDEEAYYDCVISNPPYYKLNKDSAEARLMKEFVSGQPNIYTFFMALSLEMLKPGGQMVFITPRSFCSGLYFKRFRKWLVRNGVIESLHVFESRKDIFGVSDVLQENVIIKIIANKNGHNGSDKATVSVSSDSTFRDIQKMSFAYKDLFHEKKDDVFIKIPSSQTDIEVQHVIKNWKESIESLGLKASTGPVVSFRAKKHLTDEQEKGCVPLLWMHNLKGFDVVWPLPHKKDKESAIKDNKQTKSLLLPVKNYVLVKRFSSKEQKRRLYAAVMKKKTFDFDKVGIENHLNYIYRKNGELSAEEAYGVAALLNSFLMDKFFRMLNGNTQVNVVDINNLSFPDAASIREIGKAVIREMPPIGKALDSLICEKLGTSTKILDKLYREE